MGAEAAAFTARATVAVLMPDGRPLTADAR